MVLHSFLGGRMSLSPEVLLASAWHQSDAAVAVDYSCAASAWAV